MTPCKVCNCIRAAAFKLWDIIKGIRLKWLAVYIWNILIALDQLGNAFLFGDPDETISSRGAKAARDGKAWGCILCKLLDYIDPNHCVKSLEEDEGSRAVFVKKK